MIQQTTHYLTKILNKRELCDLEMLCVGGFAPLNGFMTQSEYASVLKTMRLPNGKLFPIPITLSINEEEKALFENEEKIILTDKTGLHLAQLTIESIYAYDLETEAKAVFGCYDMNHPYIAIQQKLLEAGRIYYIGGTITQLHPIPHYDFHAIRLTPEQTKAYFTQHNWKTIVAFQTRNPMHKSHYHLTLNALKEAGEDAKLLLHPVVGVTQDIDIDYHLRVRCYKKLIPYYPKNTALLALLPLSMRMGGPKEALWHAIIRKNYGATHFIIGRDHAGPSYKRADGSDFFGPYDAQELVRQYAHEIGITILTSKMISYVKSQDEYLTQDNIKSEMEVLELSGTKQRELLKNGEPLPSWFSFPEIIEELQLTHRPNSQKGFAVYFVGIPASGKSTMANVLQTKLLELVNNRNITVLDGNVVRLNLSKGLGFSAQDRSINVQRIGYVASEIVKHHGIAIAANIAPFKEDRQINRERIERYGQYIEVYVKTSLQTCQKRDPRDLYKKAKAGLIPNLTGYNDRFDEPENPELVLNGETTTIEVEVDKITTLLKNRGLL